jgi:hypothetical protein
MSAETRDQLDLRTLLDRPALALVADGVRVSIGPTRIATGGPAPFRVAEPGELIVAPAALASGAAAVHLRHGLELAWLLTTGAPPPLAGLLAARAAALFFALEKPAIRQLGHADPALALLAPLAGPRPAAGQLAALWPALSRYQAEPLVEADASMLDRAAALWPFAGPVEHLLTTGGDARIELDPDSGRNRYGCAPRPEPAVIGFASCTASSPSERGYRAAEACRRRLLGTALRGSPAAGLAAEARAIRAAILHHYGATELAEAILAPSGTDATLLLTGLLVADLGPTTITSILVDPAETGSGVPAAARGVHFAERAAGGAAVHKGAQVGGFPAELRLDTIPLRNADANPVGTIAVDRAFAAAAEAAISTGPAVLHIVDCSKTGLAAPSVPEAARLSQRPPDRVRVVVDACQARVDRDRVRQYLRLGWPVLLTGSKFFGGPPFSGAILMPRGRLAAALAAGSLPAGLADYLGCAPQRLPELGVNPGLVLRWTAALAEMNAFAAAPLAAYAEVVDGLGERLRGLLQRDRRFRLVPVPHSGAAGWSGRQTIFPIMLRDPADPARWLSPAALERVCCWMNADVSDLVPARDDALARRRYHVGQPVRVGRSGAGPIGALRIAFGADLASAVAAAGTGAALAASTARLEGCVAKLALVLDGLPDLLASAA